MTTSQQTTAQPIGIFDSGIGGLTIAQAIMKLLPQENIIYFGDTAHFPYGEKSIAAIQSYSLKIANLLLQQNCKLILIACNSASSAAYSLLKQHVGSQALVMDVIDPLVSWISQNYAHQKTKMGLIGTKATVHSNVYKKKIDALNLGIELSSYSTNLLASAIEEFGNHEVINGLLSIYLEHPALKNIEALILACTHYPVVKERIAAYYNNKVDIIDSSDIVAQAVKSTLEHAKLLNTHKTGSDHFYISDNNLDAFKAGTKLFFNHEIALKPYPLWD